MMTRVTALILAITMVFVVACGSKEVDKAKQYMDAGMYEQAMELLKMEVGSNPKNAEAHFLLGTCHLMQNNGHEAQESFERAILLEPKYRERIGEAYVKVATESLEKKDLRRAEGYFREAVDKNFLTRKVAAQTTLEAVRRWSPDSAQTNRLAQVYREVSKEAPQMRETVGKACMETAQKYIEVKMFDDGAKLLEVATEMDPGNIQPAAELYYDMGANTLNSLGDIGKALDLLKKSMKLSPDITENAAKLCFESARKYIQTGTKSAEAGQLLEAAVDSDPQYIQPAAKLYYDMGASILNNLGDINKAGSHLNKCMQLSDNLRKDVANLYQNAALEYLNSGSKFVALRLARKSKDLDENCMKRYLEILSNMDDVNVVVPGNALWVETPIVFEKGDRFGIRIEGEVNAAHPGRRYDKWVGPAGAPNLRGYRRFQGFNLMALVGKVGESGAPFLVGEKTEFEAMESGILFLGINDTILSDNRGDFRVTISFIP